MIAINQPSLLLIISAVFSLALSLYAYKRKDTNPAILYLAYMLMASAIWSLCYGLEQASTSLEIKKLIDIFTYTGITTVPVLWFIFAARYTSKDSWLTPFMSKVLFIIPVLTVLLLATNDRHHLVYASTRLAYAGGYSFLDIQRGLYWRFIHIPYSYGLLLSGFLLFMIMFFKVERMHRSKIAVLVAATGLPLMVNIAYLNNIKPYGYLDLTPISFILTMVIYLFGILKTDLFGVVPVALDTLYNNLPDPVFVLNTAGKLISSNHAGKKIMLSADFQKHSDLHSWFSKEEPGTSEIHIDDEVHLVSKTRIIDKSRHKGNLIAFRNITLKKREENTARMNEERAVRQRTALAEMVLDDTFVQGNIPVVYEKMTQMLSNTMEVERASIWFLEQQGTVLSCHSIYERKNGCRVYSPVHYAIKDFPHYFQAITENSVIDAENAQQDPRTQELAAHYLKPLGITSLLDACIIIEGKLTGLISLEHVGMPRKWHTDEEAFASTAAALVGQIFVNARRKEAEDALRESEAKKTALIESINDLIFVLDENLVFKECYTPESDLLLLTPDEFIGKHINDIEFPEPANSLIYDALVKTLQTGKPAQTEHYIDFPGGRCWFDARMTIIGEHGNRQKMILYTSRDITDRKTKETYIEYLSFNDQLTGLYNRRFFDEELKRLDTKRNYPLTLLIIDVNGLKLTNDAFGHQEGDRLLQEVAFVMKHECRADEIISRVGGDEFVILLPSTESAGAEKLIHRIEKSLRNKEVSGLPISVSFGWDTKIHPSQPIEDTYKKAEDRMYHNKVSDRQKRRQQSIQLIMEALWKKIPRAEAHSKRVSFWCGRIGEAMGLSKAEIDELETAGRFHDIGKISVTNEILNNEMPLSEAEWLVVKRHPEVSYNILSTSNDYGPLAEIVLTHHEHWDGSGYPGGKRGDTIPLAARILAVADAFDKIASDNPASSGTSLRKAVEILKSEAGKKFDPDIIQIFLESVLPFHITENNPGKESA
jgi:diguanylate cyclase (GGDEF)-like protein/PAS domain S-box-containing protein